ncbi:flagellin [Tissierella sp. MSJ-40]|uniref:Flagellin n=1 Tax=Tissierella simiarum TaxID=2841534 RepID=A0ABS6E1A3_9FIRM|nr:flagellin [Tissierella simiarum]MBU5436672.1 flagellin [Tissierella simiarum]
MRINNNMMAMNTHRQLGIANNAGAKSMEKLSSGFRINRAGDDAAGLAISEKMRGQIRGLNMASKNAQDGISMIQTAEGGLQEVHAILQRMRELVTQGANDTYATADRSNITDELKELTAEVGRIKDTIQFNTKKLLNGTAGSGVTFQVGANSGEIMTVNFKADGVNLSGVHKALADALGELDDNSNLVTENFQKAITTINTQLETVSKGRSLLGAAQNRLEHTIKNLDNAAENLQAAESRIRDVDMAKEMMEMTRQNILQQASTAMLAQANQAPQTVLQLLR